MAIGRNRRKKILFDSMNGSLTIEASLVLPLVIFCLIWLVYITCFLYDKTAVESMISRITVKGCRYAVMEENMDTGVIPYRDKRSMDWKQENWKEEDIKNMLGRTLEEGMLLGRMTGNEFQISKKEIEAEGRAKLFLPIRGVRFFAGGRREWEIGAARKIALHDPTEALRKYERIKEMVLEYGDG
jgi:hypothetical protein